MVRRRISLRRNKRLRDALSVGGDPVVRLEEELPAAVMIEWDEAHPDERPPSSSDETSEKELSALTNRAARRLERQADEGDKVLGALWRTPGYLDEDEEYELAE